MFAKGNKLTVHFGSPQIIFAHNDISPNIFPYNKCVLYALSDNESKCVVDKVAHSFGPYNQLSLIWTPFRVLISSLAIPCLDLL